MIALLAGIHRGDANSIAWLLLLILGLVSMGLAVWRATLRDVLGTVLLGVLGIVLLVLAL